VIGAAGSLTRSDTDRTRLRRQNGQGGRLGNKPTKTRAAMKSPGDVRLLSCGHRKTHWSDYPMNGTWKRTAAGALCLGIIAVATVGAAQDRPPGPPGLQRGPVRQGPDRQKMFEQMRQRREQQLHDVLQIKPDQEAAFHAYLAAIAPPRPEGKDGQRGLQRGPDFAPPTTPQRLEREAARIAREQAALTATRTFYAALSPEQRKAFDAMPMRMGHGGGHGGPGRGGHHFEGQR
jgi:protein CpxP